MDEKWTRVVIHDSHGNVIADRPLSPEGATEQVSEHNADQEAHPYLQGQIEDAEAAAKAYADGKVSEHDVSQAAHTDMREALQWQRTQIGNRITDLVIVKRDGTEESKAEVDSQGNKIAVLNEADLGKVAGIIVNDSEEDEPIDNDGKVHLTIPQNVTDLEDADEYATKEDAQAMVDEAKVTGASVDYQEDGGSPSATVDFSEGSLGFTLKNMKMKFSDLSPEEIAAITGPQGIPGEGAIWTGEGEEIMTLEQETGQAINKAMSQKAVSDSLLPVSGIDNRWTWRDGVRMHIGTPSVLKPDANFQTSYPLAVEVGDVVEVTTAGDGTNIFAVIAYLQTSDAGTWTKKAGHEVATSAVNTYKWTANVDGYVVVCGLKEGMSAKVVKANRLAKYSELKNLENEVKNKVVAELELTAISGYYYDASGLSISNNNYKRTDYINLSQYVGYKVRITLPSDYASDSACHVLKDGNGKIVKSVSNSSIVSASGKFYDMPVIKEGYSIGFSWKSGKSISVSIINTEVKDVMGEIQQVGALSSEISSIENKLDAVIEISIPVTQSTLINYTKSASIAAGVNYTLECLSTEYVDSNGFNLKITYSDDSVSGTLSFKPGDKLSRTEAKAVKSFNFQRSAGGAIGSGNVKVVLELMNSINGRLKKLEKSSSENIKMFVSTNGSDTNDGRTLANAKATINSALASGAEIVMVDGGTYFMDIDLSKAKRSRVSIKGVSGKKVIIKGKNSTICDDGSEELVDGYENVYKVPVSYPHMPYRWLYFDGLNDEDTLISAAERHPSQRGKFYRCESTRIVPCSSDTLEAALEEIEAATKYKWYFDNGYLYFNRYASTETYPLMDSGTGSPHIKGNSSVYTPIDLEISNIEFRYEVLNVANLNSVHLTCVASKYVRGNGAILYDRTINAKFENCEAARACDGSYGDGFNAHAANSDAGSRGTYAQLIDCWSHDNMDDGYSDHEYSEVLIMGGLYEYNGKAGITPSYGSHLNGHNILSRRNYCGYYYIGSKLDGGNEGQMALYNCISDSNNRGGQMAGYYIDYGNDAILYNCIAMNETTGFKCSSSQMKLIDCKVANCTSAKEGATITVVNGTSLT